MDMGSNHFAMAFYKLHMGSSTDHTPWLQRSLSLVVLSVQVLGLLDVSDSSLDDIVRREVHK
jgi:hypothetical protein